MMRSVGNTLSLVWDSVCSWSAARRGGEPLEGRRGRFMLDSRLHNASTWIRDSLVYRLIAGDFDYSQMRRNNG